MIGAIILSIAFCVIGFFSGVNLVNQLKRWSITRRLNKLK